MELAEIIDGLKIKIKEAKKISDLGSRHFGFKNWHTTTLNLLRNLPSGYLIEINDFKKLAFEDTKYHRGNRFFSQTDNTRYREDLGSAAAILEKIVAPKNLKKPKIGASKAAEADDAKTADKKPPVKKPGVKKQEKLLTASVKNAKKPKTSKDVRSPAKTGKASRRKMKPVK